MPSPLDEIKNDRLLEVHFKRHLTSKKKGYWYTFVTSPVNVNAPYDFFFGRAGAKLNLPKPIMDAAKALDAQHGDPKKLQPELGHKPQQQFAQLLKGAYKFCRADVEAEFKSFQGGDSFKEYMTDKSDKIMKATKWDRVLAAITTSKDEIKVLKKSTVFDDVEKLARCLVLDNPLAKNYAKDILAALSKATKSPAVMSPQKLCQNVAAELKKQKISYP